MSAAVGVERGYPKYDRAFPGFGRERRLDRFVFVYVLVCPLDGTVRYVGQTKNWRQRRRAHRDHWSEEGNRLLREWKRMLWALGKRPLFAVVDTCTPSELDALEQYWVTYYRKLGRLCNVHRGGAQLPKRSR